MKDTYERFVIGVATLVLIGVVAFVLFYLFLLWNLSPITMDFVVGFPVVAYLVGTVVDKSGVLK